MGWMEVFECGAPGFQLLSRILGVAFLGVALGWRFDGLSCVGLPCCV